MVFQDVRLCSNYVQKYFLFSEVEAFLHCLVFAQAILNSYVSKGFLDLQCYLDRLRSRSGFFTPDLLELDTYKSKYFKVDLYS